MKNKTNSILIIFIFTMMMVLGMAAAADSTHPGNSAANKATSKLESSGDPSPKPEAITPGPVPEELIISGDGGLEWVWASPCNGGCGQPDPNNQEGWRFATDEELQLFPGCDAFKAQDQSTLCGSEYFDPDHTHCDFSNCVDGWVCSSPFQTCLNGQSDGNAESFFIRGEVKSTPPALPVPTLSQWALILLMVTIALLSVLRFKRKHYN